MDKNYCRLCLKQDTWNSPLSVFADYEILSKIFLVHGIKILESDSFSKVICHLCLAKLEFMDGVRKKVAISNSILNGIVQAGDSRLSTETQTVSQLDDEQQLTELRCDKCEFNTNKTSLLLAHVDLHNSISTRNCPRCPATLLTEDDLVLHLKRKHKNRTLAIHYCQQCAKLVYGNEQFSKHCQQHAPADAQSRTTKKKHKRDKVKAKPVTETPRQRIVLKISKTTSNDDDSNGQAPNNPKPADNNPKPSVNNNSVTSVKDNVQTNKNNFQTSVTSIKDTNSVSRIKDSARTNKNNLQTSVTSIKDTNSVSRIKDSARTNKNNLQTSVTSIKDTNSVSRIKDSAQTNKNNLQTSDTSIKDNNSVSSIKDSAQTNTNNFQTSVASIKDNNYVSSIKDRAQTNKNNFQTSVTSIKDNNSVSSIKDSAQTNKNNVQTLLSTKLQTTTNNKENVLQTTGRSEASRTAPAKKRRVSVAECCEQDVKENNFVSVEEAKHKTVAKTSDQFGTTDENVLFDLIDSDLETDEIYSKQDTDNWMSDTNGSRLESSLSSSIHNQSQVVGLRQSWSDDKVGQQMDSDIQMAVDEWDPVSASQRIYIDVDEDDDVIDCHKQLSTSSGESCRSFASLEMEDVIEIKDEYLSD